MWLLRKETKKTTATTLRRKENCRSGEMIQLMAAEGGGGKERKERREDGAGGRAEPALVETLLLLRGISVPRFLLGLGFTSVSRDECCCGPGCWSCRYSNKTQNRCNRYR